MIENAENVRKEQISHQLIDFIEQSSGWFWTTDIYLILNIKDVKDKTNIRVQLHNYSNKGLLEKDKIKDGRWRRVDDSKPALMDFSKVDTSKTVECYLPFHLEDFFKIYPSNVFIYSGVSNYGKTELLLMTAFLNQHRDSIYFNTDADAEEMLDRIQVYQPHDAWRTQFPRKCISDEIPNIIARHYSDDFVFIDYLKVTKEYYEIAGLIERVGQAMNKGIAFIGLQKNKGVDWARGGQQTLDLSRLYLNLDPGVNDVNRQNGRTYPTTEMKIIKCKMLKNSHYNPNGWKFIYRLQYEKGNIPTYKMIYEPPEYAEFNNKRKLAEIRQQPKPVEIEVNPEQDIVEANSMPF